MTKIGQRLGLRTFGRSYVRERFADSNSQRDRGLNNEPSGSPLAHGLSALVRQMVISMDTVAKQPVPIWMARVLCEAHRILSPIRNCSHILLACTHYPAIEPMLKRLVSPDSVFLDPASELLKHVARWDLPLGAAEFLTTGEATQMKLSARRAFGVDIRHAEIVRL